jgi:hypothetical protein
VFVRTAYKCRAYPDPEQASVLNRTFGCVRVVSNRTLAWRRQRYHAEKAGTSGDRLGPGYGEHLTNRDGVREESLWRALVPGRGPVVGTHNETVLRGVPVSFQALVESSGCW